MNSWIDAHHHLWDLQAVNYPWLMASGVKRFFGDPTPIKRDYLISEFRSDASVQSIGASVHIQVGAEDAMAEARWVQSIADANPDWPMAQVVFCDLTASELTEQLECFPEPEFRAWYAPDHRPRAGRGRANRNECPSG